ncbi:MAG: hypothetical protein COV59_01840 [Candidatus Magasanikbacteria bacterium CG11_big_fil_rev_8_21_14_0_20_39_34]|uniref:Uncharacterized protein n=1 Tax=Candidatus Magasanikbacteria bacterium CG11_big_fil_rev_8_21_14_0_20_39_34 TaxID=1974653 RepID=A0A2H0N4V2_9BACT|nr:MAG: hypothetical protein COV59_01840 [Candidatus Magasanikbacteria bacterium CG11_big_fil_rev_8_21_14_0_20_39_34]
MSKYLVSLGVVWVAISLIIGIILVVAPQNSHGSATMKMHNGSRQTSSDKVAVPVVNNNDRVDTKLYVEGTPAKGEGHIDSFVRVMP